MVLNFIFLAYKCNTLRKEARSQLTFCRRNRRLEETIEELFQQLLVKATDLAQVSSQANFLGQFRRIMLVL